MNNFVFYAPTKLVFGKETEKQVGSIIAEYGYKKILVHYGQGSVKSSGLLERVLTSLKEANVQYVLLGGVKPNPEIDMVREAIPLCKKEQVEL
ncbi:MAG: iron-containing alcohol dehydrogenase, partial [Methanomicrobia archaeon]|nr:iron-containing alcohol dehydrogenase [Methanomicrobia archaeon]